MFTLWSLWSYPWLKHEYVSSTELYLESCRIRTRLYMTLIRCKSVTSLHTPKERAQHAVLARTSGSHQQHFQPHLDSKPTKVDYLSLRSDAVVSNVIWPTRNLTRWDSWRFMRKAEKMICFIACTVDLYRPPGDLAKILMELLGQPPSRAKDRSWILIWKE